MNVQHHKQNAQPKTNDALTTLEHIAVTVLVPDNNFSAACQHVEVCIK